MSPLARPFHARDAVAAVIGAPLGSCTRLPVLCPAQAGLPLHVCLLRPEDGPLNGHYAVIDVRRLVAPPRPHFCFTRLPDSVDLRWLRTFLREIFPEAAPCSWAFFDLASLQCTLRPTARVHLITVIGQPSLRPGEGAFHTPAVVDTLDLLALRPGWHQAVARHPGASALPAQAPRALPVPGSGDIVRWVPSPAEDDFVTLWDCSLAPLKKSQLFTGGNRALLGVTPCSYVHLYPVEDRTGGAVLVAAFGRPPGVPVLANLGPVPSR